MKFQGICGFRRLSGECRGISVEFQVASIEVSEGVQKYMVFRPSGKFYGGPKGLQSSSETSGAILGLSTDRKTSACHQKSSILEKWSTT